MKAIVYDKKQAPYKQEVQDVEIPAPKENEVLLKVISVALNAADYRSMKMGVIPKRKIFGSAVSGIVEAVGDNITRFKLGDEVVGDLTDFGFGGLAEFAVAPEKAFIHKQPNTSFEDSATLPVAATTALKALRDKGNIQRGQEVLIVGSSGGVGVFALQLATYFGAKVTAVCSTKNQDQATSLGAENVIDYTKTDFTKGNERYDLILAVNGNYPLFGYRRMLKPKGTCVMVGGSLSQLFKAIFFGWLLSFGGKKMKTLSAKADPEDLAFVAKLLANGSMKAVIQKYYAFEKAPEAMNEISNGHMSGKVIVLVSSNNGNPE